MRPAGRRDRRLTALGAMAGANQVGSGAGRVGATVLGAGVGGLAGGAAGRSLDQSAAGRAEAARFRALESGRDGVAVSWSAGGRQGKITPGPRFKKDGRLCRSYLELVTLDAASIPGRALRLPHGSRRLALLALTDPPPARASP